jgi:cytosine/adenosine deaminase-related metal-dependent hydrolase
LEGAFVLPGLINAHDHLELNHYGPLKRRDRYENAAQWIDDLRPVIRDDPAVRAHAAHPLAARLLIGGVKNLLAGATTVAHHNPRYRQIGRAFPVRVLPRYGWAHSLGMEDQPVGACGEKGGSVVRRAKDTPRDVPFFVHAAEGIDSAAALEFDLLQASGCVRANTVLVHGVGMTPGQWGRLIAARGALVWCPSSNVCLFRRTLDARAFLDASPQAWQHLCLGSDSRVTGARDLLEELRVAAAVAPVSAEELLRMVTTAAARVLRLKQAGQIARGAPADLVIVPPVRDTPEGSLLAVHRRDLRLVTIAGRPMTGSPEMFRVFAARRVRAQRMVLDDVEKIVDARVAQAISRCPIAEAGVQCPP